MNVASETHHVVVVSSACGRIAAAGALVVTVIVSGAIAFPQAIVSVGLLEAAATLFKGRNSDCHRSSPSSGPHWKSKTL
ncbi:hypothetical protein [Methylorubrum aminovorans]